MAVKDEWQVSLNSCWWDYDRTGHSVVGHPGSRHWAGPAGPVYKSQKGQLLVNHHLLTWSITFWKNSSLCKWQVWEIYFTFKYNRKLDCLDDCLVDTENISLGMVRFEHQYSPWFYLNIFCFNLEDVIEINDIILIVFSTCLIVSWFS